VLGCTAQTITADGTPRGMYADKM